MTPLLRRAIVTAATAAALCLPAPTQAQGCYYGASVYADAAYSESESNLYVWGDGYDWSYCEGCYHAFYWINVYAIPPSGEYYTEQFEGVQGGLVVAVGVGATQYGADFGFWCSCFGGGVGPISYSSVINVPMCGIPIAFAETSRRSENGVLHFNYIWGSSTGYLSHLNSCGIWEDLSYSPAPWPSPPWASYDPSGWNYLAAATEGGMTDSAWTGPLGPSSGQPYAAATVSASQLYFYRCTCYANNNPVVMEGPLSIQRTVSQNADGSWRYTVSKQGTTAQINPLP